MQPLHLMNKKQNLRHPTNFQKEQFSLTRSAEYSTLHPIPEAPEIHYEIRGINDIHYIKSQHRLHLHSLDNNNVTKKKRTLLFSVLISTVICSLLKTWSELIAAQLKLVESVNTVRNTDRWQTWKVIPSGNFLAGSVRPTNSHHEYGWLYTKSLLYNYTVTTTKLHHLYFTHTDTQIPLNLQINTRIVG
jgi:hypothetical protein